MEWRVQEYTSHGGLCFCFDIAPFGSSLAFLASDASALAATISIYCIVYPSIA
jgi:hypothetical protein